MGKPKGITINELIAESMKDPKYRRVKWELQWDANWHASSIVCNLRIGSGLTTADIARKSGKHWASVRRAETEGCSLQYLSDLAKSVGKKIIISIADAEELK